MNIINNINSSKLTYIKAGGDIGKLIECENQEDLRNAIKDNFHILGAGSNTLFSHKGVYKKNIITLKGDFLNIEQSDECLIFGAGVKNIHALKACKEVNLSGMEFISGIPGTIGGGVKMNAGIPNDNFSDYIQWVEIMDSNGSIKKLNNEELGFGYRKSNISKHTIVLRACVKLKKMDKEYILNKINAFKKERIESQPQKIPTMGSTFKNIPSSAWKLIDKINLRGVKMGHAMFTEKHCNFITHDSINNASNVYKAAEDIEKLIYLAKKKVKDKLGFEIEEEVVIVKDE